MSWNGNRIPHFKVGDRVEITGGYYKEQIGTVITVVPENGKYGPDIALYLVHFNANTKEEAEDFWRPIKEPITVLFTETLLMHCED